MLIIIYRIDILNIGLFGGKRGALSWEVAFLVMGLVLLYLFMWLLSIFLVYSRVFLGFVLVCTFCLNLIFGYLLGVLTTLF